MELKLTDNELSAREMIIHPLDGLDYLYERDGREHSIEYRLRVTSPTVGIYKIGKETYTRFGPDSISMVHDHGSEVFLDLKYHDIPNTVAKASDAAVEKAVWMFNMHISGSRTMMNESIDAVEMAAEKYGVRLPIVIGVTVLTSIGPAEYLDMNSPLVPKLRYDDIAPYFGMKTGEIERQKKFAEMLINKGYDNLVINDNRGMRSDVIEQQVESLAQKAYACNLDGIVCAAADLSRIKNNISSDLLCVTPGIKGPRIPAGTDQLRVLTPGKAYKDGADYEVIGRAISDPRTADEKKQDIPITEDMMQIAGYEILQDIARYM